MAPYVKGYLAAGSTSDGWVLNAEQHQAVTTLALESAAKHKQRILVGVLKPTFQEQLEALRETAKWITGSSSSSTAGKLIQRNDCGFTVCAPRGASLTPMEMEYALSNYLELGLPIALYQLPQVTQNEIPPDLIYSLIIKYPNLVLFKDSSGNDAVAKYKKKRGDLSLLRGAEGDYARWYVGSGGPYHGFLLSTANCFSASLHQIIDGFTNGHIDGSMKESNRLSALVHDLFAIVANLKDGNAFANSNKSADHFMAYGPKAASLPPPRLQSGNRLPVEVLQAAGDALRRHGYMPTRGYLE
jgi:dihydrodipicolinate synthase/N-acetylneuraminate lyase